MSPGQGKLIGRRRDDEWVPTLLGEPLAPRRRLRTPLEQDIVRRQVHDWLDEDVIQPTERQPLENNLVLVEKKTGGTRVCIDCTPVNKVTAPHEWALPRLQDVRHQLKGSTWFVRIDLKSAFFRMRVPVEFRRFLAFESDGRAYRFKKMPFGVTTGPTMYQQFMDRRLAPLKGTCLWYIDDILVFADSREEVEARASRVRRLLTHNGMTVNVDKGEGPCRSLLFAGMWVYSQGVGPNNESLKALANMTAPRTKKELQSALGLVSYLRDHVPLVSHFTASLYPGKEGLLPPDRLDQEWGKLRRHVIRAAQQLHHFDESADADLYADASGWALGVVLIQKGKIIALSSKKLTGPETRYSATDREHLALKHAALHFRLYLHRGPGAVTRVHSDHAALLTRKVDNMTPRQFRWKEITDHWLPNVKHVAGHSNPADWVSRWKVELVGGAMKTI